MLWTTYDLNSQGFSTPERPKKMFILENVIFRSIRLSLGHFGQQAPQLQNGLQNLLYLLSLWTYRRLKITQGPTPFFNGNFRGC